MTNGTGRSIVFFATAWGTRYGGINSFNFDISRALAKLVADKFEVICVIPRAEKEQIKEAKKQGVKLIGVRCTGPEDRFMPEDIKAIEKLFAESLEGEVRWWIGHDVRTGRMAIEAARKTSMGHIALFHHMDYQSYLAAIPIDTLGPISKQREVLNEGDIVFAIGPKLARSARDMVRVKDITVQELIPGSHDIKVVTPPENFSAIVFGRLSKRTDCVKQARLAVAGFSHASSSEDYEEPLKPDSSLMVIGLPDGEDGKTEREELKVVAEKYYGGIVQIHPWPYFRDRNKLFDELRLKSVCLVTSLYEGFGLAGWEAISAGVPLITTTNSGLYEFVDKRLPQVCIKYLKSIQIKGSAREDYSEDDVATVSGAILEVNNNNVYYKDNAKRLKKLMQTLCTWQNCARILAASLGIIEEKTEDKDLCSEESIDEICKKFDITKEQYHEMLENIRAFYSF